MNTVAHNIASKLFVAFVAVAMLFTLVTPAKAATAEEMQQMINDLLAQVAALQTNVGGSSSAMCPFTWTRGLNVGATGADVMKLQQFLNSDADTRVSASGVGSVGMETEYYGPATSAAVSKFQVKYRSDILSPAGLVNPTGYFGPSTMAKANALCVTAPADDSDDSDDSSDDDSDDSSDELSGEASLESFDIEDGDDTDVEEGQEDAPVLDFKVEFSDGDAMITRLDVNLDTDATDDIWEILDTVTLWVDGDEVASVDASDEDNYQSDDETLRISGLDIVAMEDDELTITLGVSVQDNLDDNDQTVTVDVTGLRFVDGDDVTTTEDAAGVAADTNTFEIQAEGIDDELIIKSSSEDPEATTLELEDDSKSDWTTIFAYTLDTDDSTNDITVNDLRVDITATDDGTTATSTAFLVDDAQLVIDGETFDDVTIVNGTTGTYSFDTDGDLVIEAGEEVAVEFQVKFKALATAFEGSTVQASTSAGAGYDAEGADDLEGSQLDGSSQGDEHTLRTEGVVVELTDSNVTSKANTDTTLADDEGVYTLEFDVTAFNGDIYIDDSAASGTTMSTEGANFIVTSGGSAITTGTRVATLDSDAELTSGRFKVAEGETESFTLTVEFDPESTGSYKVQLYSVNFKVDTNGAPDTQQLALPAEDFDTASLTI